MKLSELSHNLLEFMVNSYSANHKKIFSFTEVKEALSISDNDEDFLMDAYRVLSKDGLISIQWADDQPSIATLQINAIV